jgi:hypothetical protein
MPVWIDGCAAQAMDKNRDTAPIHIFMVSSNDLFFEPGGCERTSNRKTSARQVSQGVEKTARYFETCSLVLRLLIIILRPFDTGSEGP